MRSNTVIDSSGAVLDYLDLKALAKIGIFYSDLAKIDAERIESFLIVADELAQLENEKMSKGRRK
jgi:hypothetical protein